MDHPSVFWLNRSVTGFEFFKFDESVFFTRGSAVIQNEITPRMGIMMPLSAKRKPAATGQDPISIAYQTALKRDSHDAYR